MMMVHPRSAACIETAFSNILTRLLQTVADFYIVLLQNIHADVNSVPHGREGFFFTVGDEHDMYTLSKAVSQALVDLGKGQSSEPSTFTKEEIEKYLGVSPLITLAYIFPETR